VQRVCFQFRVKPERLPEYRERHAAVWPEFLAALRDTGWRNYSIFEADGGLMIGYFETESLDAAQAGMAAAEVNARWQESMAPFFEEQGPDDAMHVLPEIFNLDAQLAASTTTTNGHQQS
jgi:L-rhamnose mutarotase